MKKKLMILAGSALAVVILGAALIVPTLAQEPAPEPGAPLDCRGRGFGLWGGGWSVFDAAAEALGLTPEGLFGELHGGKTLADVAGDDLEVVQEAVQAARTEHTKEAIAQAVEDGRLTQEQADWMLEGQEQGFMRGRGGFGHGMRGGKGGFGMRGGAGQFGPSRLPSIAPSSSS